ncbi:ABC transporter ATP-binding protein [Pseudactinotalea sp.]|uniref:ABC transporter ATP-binding protein n=1 Tax=Pseudactinotalea sp. TaxID=1926260 RepID=UPI003B3AC292
MIRTLLSLVPVSERGRVRTYVVLTLVSVLLRAAAAVLLVPLIAALVSPAPADAWRWLGALTAVTVAGWLVDAAAARRAFDIGFEVLESTQHKVADRLTRIRMAWFGAENTADARYAIATTGPDLIGLIVNLVTPFVSAVLLPAAIALGLMWVSPLLAVAALAAVPLMLGAVWFAGRATRHADAAAAAANTELTERLVEFGRTQEVLRASRRATPARSQVAQALAGQHAATLRLVLLQAPGQLVFSLASQIALIALAGTTAWLTIRGDLDLGAAIGLVVVVVRFLEPMTTIAQLAPALESTRLALVKIRAVLDAPEAPAGRDAEPVGSAPRIELRGIEVRHGDAPPVISGLDLVLEPGSTTAVVGPSGSGKTTLLTMIAGLLQPTGGQVLLDGRDASALTVGTHRDAVSMVFQHPFLFEGTIRENVLVGAPSAGHDAVAAATELARVDEITQRLPEGRDSAVGEAGGRLSGGARQRVSIARALLKPAPILLVDEATSALDPENERAVVDALTRDPLPRTRVIVAHRLTSIEAADRVLFFEDGRIVEDGTPAELRAAGGRFAAFTEHQQRGARWRLRAEV